MAEIHLNAIKLVQITTEMLPNGRPCKAVVLRYENRGGDSLSATYVVEENQVRDEALVSVAKNWCHRTYRDIASATEGWEMNEAQLKDAEHPSQTPQSFSRYQGPQ